MKSDGKSQLTHSPRYPRRMPRRMPVDTECAHARRDGQMPHYASCGFPSGIRGILEVYWILCYFCRALAPEALPPGAPAPQTPGPKNRPVGSAPLFRLQTVALLYLPPLAEFEEFPPSRPRAAAVGASTFSELKTKLVGGTSANPAKTLHKRGVKSWTCGFAAGANCWVLEV